MAPQLSKGLKSLFIGAAANALAFIAANYSGLDLGPYALAIAPVIGVMVNYLQGLVSDKLKPVEATINGGTLAAPLRTALAVERDWYMSNVQDPLNFDYEPILLPHPVGMDGEPRRLEHLPETFPGNPEVKITDVSAPATDVSA